MDTIHFDNWRSTYDNSTYQEHVEFYERIYKEYPRQIHFNEECAINFFESCASGRSRVLEVGGWHGELAKLMLDRFPDIQTWFNFDLCRSAIEHGISNPRLVHVWPPEWVWDMKLPACQVFVASHTLEHMRLDQVDKLFARLSASHAYIDVPTSDSWEAYPGTHILTASWGQIEDVLEKHGFRATFNQENIHFLSR